MAKKNDIAKAEAAAIQSVEQIENLILTIRGKQVILDRDLARLYGVETFRLNEQVKRNIERFPEDFMFQLTKEEFENWKLQIAISSWGGTRKLPYAFTENGVSLSLSLKHKFTQKKYLLWTICTEKFVYVIFLVSLRPILENSNDKWRSETNY